MFFFFKIKAAKVRGQESNGMLCSLQDLGIEEKYVPEEFKNEELLNDVDLVQEIIHLARPIRTKNNITITIWREI